MTSTTYDLSKIFNGTGYINKRDCQKYVRNHNVTHIILMQSNNSPIKIDDYFLYEYDNLISVDMPKIINVIAIGNYFLFNCYKLTHFDTTKLTSLTTIGNSFLSYCANLTIFDATELTALNTIGENFLYGCGKLTVFDASGLTTLTAIGENFLFRCNNNLIITVKNPPDCLTEQLIKTDYKFIQLYDKPVIHLNNNCVI